MSYERRIGIILMGIVATMSVGTGGYMLIEGWPILESLYMTIITLATVGFSEVHPLSNPGRMFTSGLIIVGVGTVAYGIGSLTEMMVEGKILDTLGRRKVKREIKKLKDHYIVCGYGRIGRIVCREFREQPVPFIVVERRPEIVEEVIGEGLLAIQGDATDEDALRDAGIEQAKALISVVSSDADNVFITLTARELNPRLLIVARAEEKGADRKLLRAGADKVVSPYLIGGHRLAHAVLRPAVVDFIELATASKTMDLLMEEIEVKDRSRIEGKALKDSGISQDLGIIVIGIKRRSGGMLFNPSSSTEILLGDKLIALGNPEQIRKLEELARR